MEQNIKKEIVHTEHIEELEKNKLQMIQTAKTFNSSKDIILQAFGAFFVTFFVFFVLLKIPFGDIIFRNYIAHSAVLFITCLTASYASFVAYRSYVRTKAVNLLITSLSFFVFGLGFLIHTVILPFSPVFNEAIFDLTEHVSLFLGAFIFFGLTFPFYGKSETLYKNRGMIFLGAFIFLMVVFSIVVFNAGVSDFIENIIKGVVIMPTAIFFAVGAYLLIKKYNDNKTILSKYLIISFAILVNSAIIPLFYKEWSILWWYFHFVFLFGFVLILFGIIKSEKEESGFESVFNETPLFSKISTKISFIVAVLALLMSIGLGYSVFYYTKVSLGKSIGENQLQTAKATMTAIDRILYERYLDIQEAATSVIIEKYVNGTGNKEEFARRINGFRETSGPWDSVEVWSMNKTILFSTETEWFGSSAIHNEEERLAFEKASKGGIYYSDLVISGSTGKPTMYFAAPVRSIVISGEPVVAIVVGQFAWPAIEEILAKTGIEQTHTHLFNKREQMIATNGDRKDLFSETAKFEHSKDFPEGKALSAVTLSNESKFTALVSQAPEEGYLGYKGNDWEVLMESPTDIAFAAATDAAIRTAIVLVVMILLIAIVLLLALYRLILTPIQSISETIFAIAEEGDLTKRVLFASDDEIGTLAVSFNTMTEKLSKAQTDATQRTEELASQNEELEEASAELEEAKIGLEQKVKERTIELETSKASLEVQVADRTQELKKVNSGLEEEVVRRTAELQAKLMELERFNKVAVGRELKMVELKEEIARLKSDLVSKDSK